MIKRIHVTAVTLLVVIGCSEADPLGPPIQFSASERRLVEAGTGFGFNLYRALAAGDTSPNLFVSPFSISMALGMALNGAAGQTLTQMRSVLTVQELSETEINQGYRSAITQLLRRDRDLTIALANSMWPAAGLALQDSFSNALRTFFNAEVRTIDFGNAEAAGIINQWAEQATRGRIKDLFDQLEPNTRLVLINAIYFKAPWTEQFKVADTREADFTRADGSVATVPIMRRTGTYAFRFDQDVIALEAPYANEAFSMVLVRPASGSLASLEAGLTPAWWNELVGSLRADRVTFRLPRFRIEYGKQLNDVLKTLGMPAAFDGGAADFSRITGAPGLYISQVQHKAFVEVNEQGTEAAAATGIALPDSAPPEVSFDQPFLFAIRERESGVILFMGRVGDPSSD